MIRRLIIMMLVCALAAPLGACGKKAPNEPPPGEKSDYPKPYPL